MAVDTKNATDEQEALAKKLREAQQQLIQSEKLASIGQLAAGVAHEINNPVGYVSSNLATLSQYVETLFKALDAYRALEAEVLSDSPALRALRGVVPPSELEFIEQDLRDLLQESHEGLARVRRIVQDLKDFSHVDGNEWQVVDLHRGLDSVLNMVHHETKYTAQVVREYGDIPHVECIGSQINQVFMNILVNAAHAIEKHGSIVVRTTCPDPEHVCVSITDDGVGMSEDVAARVFDPFFTTKPVGKGTGLGLAVSYGIVNKHGGRIEVESRPGIGSTFRVLLPVRRARRQPAE